MSTPGVGVRVGDHLSAISVEAGSGPGSVAAWSIHSLHRVELNRSQPNLGKRPGEGGSITASSGYVEVSAETQTHNTQTEHSCVLVCAVSDTICVSVCLACLCVFRAVEAGRPGKYV